MFVLQVVGHPSYNEGIIWIDTYTKLDGRHCGGLYKLTSSNQEHGKQTGTVLGSANDNSISDKNRDRDHHYNESTLIKLIGDPGDEAKNKTSEDVNRDRKIIRLQRGIARTVSISCSSMVGEIAYPRPTMMVGKNVAKPKRGIEEQNSPNAAT